MATSFLPEILTNIFLVLVVTAAMYAAKATDLEETKLSFYIHDISAFGNPKATVIPVAGIIGKAWTFTQFGTVYVVDANITKTPDPKSPQVGQFQGLYLTAALDGSRTFATASIVFTNKEYNGSTIQIQGTNKDPATEVAVVGGTGKFRYARGYATSKIYFLDIATQHSVVQLNVTVQTS
ncbi:pterocarpan synthase 1-like [Castanea sativa]|uniref:pterocarpan synthase 1-like n=1 Tax=Castanea sativa TaxID=21020 RepID=UPI003F6539E1